MESATQHKSVGRALEMLELIGAAFDGLSLKEIGDRMGIGTTGSLHAMLHSLVEKGYVTRTEHPIRYRIGPALNMVDRINMLNSLHRRLSPIMSSICRQSSMKVSYQQFIARRGFVLFYVSPRCCFNVRHTDFVPTTSYGTSVIFQAYMTREEQDRYWAAHPMEELDRKIWGSFRNLRKYLKTAAKQRLAVIGPQHGEPFRAIGPIFDSSGKVSAAISAIQIDENITQKQATLAAQLIYNAAVELSAPIPSQTE